MPNFDIAALIGDVAALDTGIDGREQLSYIDVSKLHADPNNFYSISGIDELCANIEMVGLQQPIRVREIEDGYMIVSGHRRTAAIRKLVEEGKEDFREVACIIEAAASSPELQELRLIYANSDTRTMTSAELSRQAERVEALLYKLKEAGYEFPGRMRDHVAAACKMSASKLARLKVIREGLKPEGLRKAYEDGHLSETCAYEIARRAEAAQELADEQLDYIIRRSAEEIGGIMDGLEREAENQTKVVNTVQATHNQFVANVEEYLSKRASEDADYFSVLQCFAKSFAARLPQMGSCRKENIDALKRYLRYSGGASSNASYDAYGGKGLALSSYARAIPEITRTWTDVYDMLAAIAINELGKQPKPKADPVAVVAPVPLADTKPEWREGLPKRDGRYYVRYDIGDGEFCEAALEYDRFLGGFWWRDGEALEAPVLGWWPLPSEEEEADN